MVVHYPTTNLAATGRIMDFDTFVKLVQQRGRLSSREAAVGAIRATLETLGERLSGGELKDVCAQLPREIAYYLSRGSRFERLPLPDFYARISMREPCDFTEAAFHARAVISVLELALSAGEYAGVRAQFPAEFNDLFESRDFIEESPVASAPGRDQS
jgi:uncharacterized protein (DUF2267 family)